MVEATVLVLHFFHAGETAAHGETPEGPGMAEYCLQGERTTETIAEEVATVKTQCESKRISLISKRRDGKSPVAMRPL